MAVLGFDFRQGQRFLSSLEPAQAPSLGVKRPGREAEHSPPTTAEANHAWSYTSTLPIRFHIFIFILSVRYEVVYHLGAILELGWMVKR
jgi:hypothetical protein